MRRVSTLALLALATPRSLPAQAQQPYQFTLEDYARAERFLGATAGPLVSGQAGRPTWVGSDGRFWYRTNNGKGTSSFWLVDPARKSRVPAFDHARLAAALGAATGTQVEPDRLPFTSFDLAPDGRSLTATVREQRWQCDLTAYACTDAGRPAALPPNAQRSPDGKWGVFIRDFNLWARELATGRDVQLTTDGIRDFGYATDNAGWVHSERAVLTFSPDSRRIATFQHDGRGVRDMHLVGTNVGVPRLETWKYPVPGDSVIFRISRVIIDLAAPDGPRVVRLQMPPDQHRSTVSDHVNCGGAICDVQWYPDGSHLAFISSSRDHKHAWLRVADAGTGAVRDVLHEESATQVGDASFPENLWRVLPASNEVIWWSDRDDWTQLYLHDLATGRLKNRITTGVGNVTGIVRIDEKARQVWFTANGREPGRDPYFQHFYRIGFDGKGLTLLTPEAANHAVSLSPDGRFFTDTWSTLDTPPVTVVRDRNGRVVQPLERADIRALVASGWRAPVPVTVKARDGVTDIYGVMYPPSRLDEGRKYPIVDYIYPGPQSGSVGSRSFVPARGDHQALAELGFVVVAIDGMGTPGRSKTFRDFYYGRMGQHHSRPGRGDEGARARGIRVHRSRAGGHLGSFRAAGSRRRRRCSAQPEFFEVGIAESGNHDNRNYEDDWGERYQGLLVRDGDSDNYAARGQPDPRGEAARGSCFLAHGMMDDNVPPYNTTLVADALIKAGKDFDLLMLPGARHGFAGRQRT